MKTFFTMAKINKRFPSTTRLTRFENGLQIQARSEQNTGDNERSSIWYALTELEQLISMAASHQAPQDVRVMRDLMTDVWLIWDRDWAGTDSYSLLILSYIERIGARLSSPAAVIHVGRLRGLIEDYARTRARVPRNVNTGSLMGNRAK